MRSGKAQSGVTWPLSKDSEGQYVLVADAAKGREYYCPECDQRFVARQGEKVRWHFAHYPGAECSGEGSRHALAKHIIARRLGVPVHVPMRCVHGLSTRDYQVPITDVAIEEPTGDYRADVALSVHLKGRVQRIYVEVVDHHPTPPEKAAALQGQFTDVVITDLSDDDVFGLEAVETRLLDALGGFLPLLAPRPHGFIHTWTGDCWRCKRPVPKALPCNEGDAEAWPQDLPDPLLAAMRKHAKVESRYTAMVREPYYANVCPHCDAVQGEWFVIDEFLELANRTPPALKTEFWPDTR